MLPAPCAPAGKGEETGAVARQHVERERERDRQTETNRDRQRQTETDGDRQREREIFIRKLTREPDTET